MSQGNRKEISIGLSPNKIVINPEISQIITANFGISIEEIVATENSLFQQDEDFTRMIQKAKDPNELDTDVVPAMDFSNFQNFKQAVGTLRTPPSLHENHGRKPIPEMHEPRGMAAVYHDMLMENTEKLKQMQKQNAEYLNVLRVCKQALLKTAKKEYELEKQKKKDRESMEELEVALAIQKDKNPDQILVQEVMLYKILTWAFGVCFGILSTVMILMMILKIVK